METSISTNGKLTLVNVRGVGFLSDLLPLLLLAISTSRRLGSLLSSLSTFARLSGSLGGSRGGGFASGRSGFGGHCERCGRLESEKKAAR